MPYFTETTPQNYDHRRSINLLHSPWERKSEKHTSKQHVFDVCLAIVTGNFYLAQNHLKQESVDLPSYVQRLWSFLVNYQNPVLHLNYLLSDLIDTTQPGKERLNIAEILISTGGDANTKNKHGRPLLTCAAMQNDRALVNLLLNKGAHEGALGQALIIANLESYIRICSQPFSKTIADELRNIRGLCFGFAVIYNYMHYLGKLNWWETALALLAHWNGDGQNLEEIIILPQQDNSSTRRQIFERILNYLISCQAISFPNMPHLNPFVAWQSQNVFFNEHGFDALDLEGNILTIKEKNIMGGYFTKHDLEMLLDENIIADSQCMVGSIKHIIQIGYQKECQQWVLYESNSDHYTKTKYEKKFKTKEKLADEIFSTLGNVLIIYLYSFTPGKDLRIPYYDSIPLESLISGKGLLLLANHAPDRLGEILNNIKLRDIPDILLQSLLLRNSRGSSALSFIAFYFPEKINAILEMDLDNYAILMEFFRVFGVEYVKDNAIRAGINNLNADLYQTLIDNVLKKINALNAYQLEQMTYWLGEASYNPHSPYHNLFKKYYFSSPLENSNEEKYWAKLIYVLLALINSYALGRRGLHFAAEVGHLNALYDLLNHGHFVDTLNHHFQTPLELASRAGQLTVVIYLLEVGANINVINAARQTPLDTAIFYNQTLVASYLQSRGAKTYAELNHTYQLSANNFFSNNSHMPMVSASTELLEHVSDSFFGLKQN